MKRSFVLLLLLASCGTAGAEIETVGPAPTTAPTTTTTAVEAPVVAAETPPVLVPAAPVVTFPTLPPTTTTTPPPLVLPDLPLCPEITYTGDIAPPLPEGFPGDCASRVPTPAELGY